MERIAAACQGYLQAVELLCNTDLGTYCLLGVPVEVHCGDADVVTPPAQCAAWAAALGRFEESQVRRALDSDRPELLALACAAVGSGRAPGLSARVKKAAKLGYAVASSTAASPRSTS